MIRIVEWFVANLTYRLIGRLLSVLCESGLRYVTRALKKGALRLN